MYLAALKTTKECSRYIEYDDDPIIVRKREKPVTLNLKDVSYHAMRKAKTTAKIVGWKTQTGDGDG